MGKKINKKTNVPVVALIICCLIFAVCMLASCSSTEGAQGGSEKTNGTDIEEENGQEDAEDESDEDGIGQEDVEDAEDAEDENGSGADEEGSDGSASDFGMYEVGEEYVIRTDLKVRDGASLDSRWKTRDELSEADKEKAVSGNEAVLAEGSKVKCLEINGDWIRIESGWICCKDPETRYVYIISEDVKERIEESRARIADKLGGDAHPGLEGRYTFADDVEGLEYVELFKDGGCAVKSKTPMFPVTDEDGYSSGYYMMKDDRLYLNWGGSVYMRGYRISGSELYDPTDEINTIG